jgi:hypothetical protein
MQDTPLLEKLDWIFTSSAWTTSFPNTIATPLARLGSDHIPIPIQIGTRIPKSYIFRFEEYWLQFEGFKEVVEEHWINKGVYRNCAQDLVANFKSLGHGIKKWSKQLSKLTIIINNCSYVIALIDGLEEQRSLSIIKKTSEKHSKNTSPNCFKPRDCTRGKGPILDGPN